MEFDFKGLFRDLAMGFIVLLALAAVGALFIYFLGQGALW